MIKTIAMLHEELEDYVNPIGTYTYRDVPSDLNQFGLNLHSENGYGFLMASPEKAICDELYRISPVRNIHELEDFYLKA